MTIPGVRFAALTVPYRTVDLCTRPVTTYPVDPMLEEGLSYPFKGENAVGRNLIGGLLLLFFWLVLPLLAFFGYVVRVLETTADGETEPPEFDDWGRLVVDGVKGVVIFVAYGIIPYAILLLVLPLAGVVGLAGSDSGWLLAGGIGITGILGTLLVMVVVQYVLPAALTYFARRGSIGAAFDIGTLSTVVLSWDYFVAWLLPIVVFIGLAVVGMVLAITVIGLILLPWLYFYGIVVTYRMFGMAFARALDVDEGTGGSGTDRDQDAIGII